MRRHLALVIPVALIIAACGDDGDAGPTASTTPPTTASGTGEDGASTDDVPDDEVAVVAGEPFPEARCAANEAAGTINYFTGFDFAAAASILEVVVADARGYFGDLCLDVAITPGSSTTNYALVAADEAQFSSAGSFSELASFAAANDADLVALSVAGHIAIDVLMVKPDRASSLADLADQTIGIKFALPPAVAVMLRQEASLAESDDFDTVLLEGFDPFAHWALEEVSAMPGWRSNEPGALERGGVEFDLYDPGDFGIPGSFGLIYTNRDFLDEHPTAAEDFMRASMRALAEAIADPDAASAIAVEQINANGNPAFLSPEGEAFRWETDAATITATTPAGSNVGVPIATDLEAQVAAYEEVGVFGDGGAPPVDGRFDADLVAGLYDSDGDVIWPAG